MDTLDLGIFFVGLRPEIEPTYTMNFGLTYMPSLGLNENNCRLAIAIINSFCFLKNASCRLLYFLGELAILLG